VSQEKALMKKVILVIEDDLTIQKLMARLLAQYHYEIVTVSTAEEALKLIEESSFDLITLDLNLPGMNSNQFLVKLSDYQPHIPVLVISVTLEMLMTHAQVKPVLRKPFRAQQLLGLVANLL
jgi:DNA-binding NtrC family response regulator